MVEGERIAREESSEAVKDMGEQNAVTKAAADNLVKARKRSEAK